MQIEEIIIFNKFGEKRVLPLQKGKVNIITGKSRTGKSAIIDIIEYCLGRSSCKIKKGVIRDTASWFGLLLDHNGEKIYVARQNPPGSQKSTDFAFIQKGIIKSPNASPEEPNTTRKGISDTLTDIIGMSANTNFPLEGQTRNPLSANLKHALFLCFQKQTEIASDEVLFHRQSEIHRTQDIKDTLPYFLGAVKENDLALRQALEKAERELRLSEISFKEAESLKGNELVQAGNLIEESKDSGLITLDKTAESQNEKIKLLKKISKLKPENISLKFDDNLEKIQDDIMGIEKQIGIKYNEIKASEKFANELKGYSGIMDLQKNKLDSIGLFEHLEQNESKCPYCSSHLKKTLPSLSSMRKTLKIIEKNLENSTKDQPKLRDRIFKLEKEKQELEIKLNQKRSDIETIFKSRQPLLDIKDKQIRQVQVLARVEFWLDNVRLTDETSILRKDVIVKKKIVETLRDELNDEKKKNKLDSALNRISQNMTKWAKELGLEHSEFPVRFYMPLANIMIDDDKGAFSLDEVGSGENLLGYHLVTHFALHDYLVNNNRPTPGFLILDQPSQVYFPKDKTKIKEDMKQYLDEDREQILKFFNFIFKRVKQMSGNFQVIVTDHAEFDDSQFQSALREIWRGKKALIPYDWIHK